MSNFFLKFSQYAWASILAFFICSGSVMAKDLVVSHWGSLYYGAPYAVALEKGYFDDNGVDIDEVIGGQGGGTTIRNMMATDIHYTESSLAAAIQAQRSGLPIKIVNTGIDTLADFVLITKKGGLVKSVDALKGKRIAHTGEGSVSHMAVMLLLDAIGLTPDDVELVATGGVGAVMTGIRNGTLDAGWTGEPLWSKEHDNVQVITWLGDVMDPQFTQMVGVVDDEYAKENPEIIEGIIKARAQGVEYIYEHPEESAAIIAKAYESDPDLVQSVVNTLVGFDYWSTGDMNIEHMQRMVKALRLVDAIDEGDVNLEEMIDSSYLEKAQK